MNFNEIEKAVKHLQKTCKCPKCNKKYQTENISVIATTLSEGLFDAFCENCELSTMVTIVLSAGVENIAEPLPMPRRHENVSENDILDMKNFLSSFDGNFKKIFKQGK